MSHVQFIQYQGTEMLFVNFSTTTSLAEFLAVIEEAKQTIASRPLHSVLTLTDVTNSYFDSNVNVPLKKYVAHNKPYVKAGAVVGISSVRKIIFNAVLFFSRRENLKTFDTLEAAKEWLRAYT